MIGSQQAHVWTLRSRAEALDDLYFGPERECSPDSIQPVVSMRNGERQLVEMKWGFKFPARLVFNARSDNLTVSTFWSERLHQRCIVPASSMLEWEKTGADPRPKYRLSVKGRDVFGMASIWAPWRDPKTGQWENCFAVSHWIPTRSYQQFMTARPSYSNHANTRNGWKTQKTAASPAASPSR